jgi:hypothetical protein
MEPERKIEKWLRAFAKKRREQAGESMELRPAARQLLQREIARQSAEKSRGGSLFNFLFGPRLRMVFAACFTALLLGGWFLWRESARTQPAQLSMNKTSHPETPPSAAAPKMPPPPVSSPTVAIADKKVQQEKLETAPTAPPATQPVILSANRAPTAAAKDADGTFPVATLPASTLIAGAPISNANAQTALAFQKGLATPNATNTALFDLAKTTGAVTVSQVFNRLVTPSLQRRAISSAGAIAGTPAPAPVLASFRVEQNGNNLKVVDGDGSVYTGSVQIAQQEPATEHTFATAKNAPVGAAARSLKADAPKPQGYFFRVAGTNRNLNENIVFSGNFVPFTTNQGIAGASGFGGFGGKGGRANTGSNQAAEQSIQAVLSNSQITGNVVIGGQKAVDVAATPAQ